VLAPLKADPEKIKRRWIEVSLVQGPETHGMMPNFVQRLGVIAKRGCQNQWAGPE
jgi:hypothetical protein